MIPSRKIARPASRWPFWLLLAAWFCANSPQAATYGLIVWLGEARHFSHQQRLTAEVASVLAGEKSPAALAVAKASATPQSPALPASAALKKTDLAADTAGEFLPPATRVRAWVSSPSAMPETLRAPPPHGPPRAQFVA